MAGLMDVLRKLEAARQLRTSDEQRYGRESRPPSNPQGTLTAGGAPVRSAAGNVGTEFGTAPVAQPSAGGGIPQQVAPPPTSAAPPPAPTTTFIPPDVKAATPELGADVQSVPFNPDPLDQGSALEQPGGVEHEGGLYAPPEEGTYADGMMNAGGDQAEGDEGPIDLGTLPAVTMYPPGEEGEQLPGEADAEQHSMDLAMQELAARMLRARQGSGARGGRRQVPPAF